MKQGIRDARRRTPGHGTLAIAFEPGDDGGGRDPGTTAHFCIFADDLAVMCTERTLEEATAAIQKVLTLLEEHPLKL